MEVTKEPETTQPVARMTEGLFQNLANSPSVISLLQHPGWEKYQTYLTGLLNFYNLAIIYGKREERDELIGKAKNLNELSQLSDEIKKYLDRKSKQGGK